MTPIAKTGLRLLIITSVLTACTFLFSLFESRPPKIIAYFILTFIFSLLLGVVALLIGRLFKSDRQAFINDPYKIILTFILVIGFGKILGAYLTDRELSKNIYTDIDLKKEEQTQMFTNEQHGVSFDYPSNWTPREPQRQSTLILLYENLGTNATCNLSMVTQDQEGVENYNIDYFRNNLPKIYSSFDNLNTQFITVNGKAISWTTYSTDVQTNEGPLKTRFITLTTLHNGQRFMMIITVPDSSADEIEMDVKTITESLKFK